MSKLGIQNKNENYPLVRLLFRRFRKSLSLRVVNWLGLSVMFACLLLSYSYIKHEFSYDRFNINASRIVRLSVQEDAKPVDGRIYGESLDPVLQQIPDIEQVVKLSAVNTALNIPELVLST